MRSSLLFSVCFVVFFLASSKCLGVSCLQKKTFFCVVAYVSILPPQQQKKKPQQLECVLIRFNKQIVTMISFVETKVESIQRQNGSCGRRLAQQLTTEVKTPSLMTEIDGRLCRKKNLFTRTSARISPERTCCRKKTLLP